MCHLFPPRPRVLINQKEKTSCAIDQIVEPNQMEKPWKSCRFWIILRNCSLLCYQGIRGDTNPPIFPRLRGGTKLWTGTRHVTSLPSRSDQARNLRHVTVTICFPRRQFDCMVPHGSTNVIFIPMHNAPNDGNSSMAVSIRSGFSVPSYSYPYIISLQYMPLMHIKSKTYF